MYHPPLSMVRTMGFLVPAMPLLMMLRRLRYGFVWWLMSVLYEERDVTALFRIGYRVALVSLYCAFLMNFYNKQIQLLDSLGISMPLFLLDYLV